MTEEEMLLSKLLQEIRVKPHRIMTVFRRLKGSFGNIMFGKKKIDNLKQAERKLKRNTYIACTMKYIERIQLSKPGFCCKMDVDGEGAVRSIFWTDARSRMDYKLYGDIICFDTTYSTNKYNMPFAPIIGINGNSRTIVFGWALLKDQTADTFQWLFESFLEIMDGKRPKLILTDQDAAMKSAIERVFWDIFHRYCIWHMLQNLKQNTSAYMAEREGMEETIVSLIMDSLHVLEFETGWKKMINTYNCGEHEHLKRMWSCREMFVPAYFRGAFCPFTRSTGRSESFNSNFKEYVLRKDTIENFLIQYELFQENVLEIENQDRYQSTQQDPTFWCHQPIERHAAKIYTRGIYSKFVIELLNSTAFGVDEIVKDKLYELRKLFYYKKPEYRREMFTVCVDRQKQTYECECGKFEKDGILCCHILRLFTQFDVVRIPDEYIMPRWTIKYREEELIKHKQQCVEVHGAEASESTLRYAMLMNSVNDVCADLSRNAAKSREFIEEVHKLHKRLMSDDTVKQSDAVTLKDPPIIKKASAKQKNTAKLPESSEAPVLRNLNVWVNEDGSISQPSEQISSKPKTTRKRKKQTDGEETTLKDPPVSSSISVIKGNRMKPQSEKNSRRKKNVQNQ
jgi:hypothetical protein